MQRTPVIAAVLIGAVVGAVLLGSAATAAAAVPDDLPANRGWDASNRGWVATIPAP